jgi:hypothetical protein
MASETLISIFLGVGLAASVGFRVFVPLFALSLASHFNIIPLNESWNWVGCSGALVILGVATFLEIFAYFIPWFDNLLDTIAVPLAAIAGTLVMVSTVSDLSPIITWALAIIAGGGTATAIQGATTTTRLTSTATTGGLANPIIATVETGSSVAMASFAIFSPVVAVLIVVALFILFRKMFLKLFRKPKSS